MNNERFHALANRYPQLRIGVVGDFFLDRYLHIDPAKAETSIETGLPVYNVVARQEPAGGGRHHPQQPGCPRHRRDSCRRLLRRRRRGLRAAPGARSPARCEPRAFHHVAREITPVYCKPLLIEAGRPPRELNRLDTKNWTPTPDDLQHELADRVTELAKRVDVLLLLDQVELPETGVATRSGPRGGPRGPAGTRAASLCWPTAAGVYTISRRSASR